MAYYHSSQYLEYLESLDWKYQRELALRRAGFRCEKCFNIGRPGNPLQVHHLNYDNLGNEKREDLKVLCEKCHRGVHDLQTRSSRSTSYARGRDTYAEKKYGEDWMDYRDIDEIENEFDNWLDKVSDS